MNGKRLYDCFKLIRGRRPRQERGHGDTPDGRIRQVIPASDGDTSPGGGMAPIALSAVGSIVTSICQELSVALQGKGGDYAEFRPNNSAAEAGTRHKD